jgi:hypothetical protein
MVRTGRDYGSSPLLCCDISHCDVGAVSRSLLYASGTLIQIRRIAPVDDDGRSLSSQGRRTRFAQTS